MKERINDIVSTVRENKNKFGFGCVGVLCLFIILSGFLHYKGDIRAANKMIASLESDIEAMKNSAAEAKKEKPYGEDEKPGVEIPEDAINAKRVANDTAAANVLMKRWFSWAGADEYDAVREDLAGYCDGYTLKNVFTENKRSDLIEKADYITMEGMSASYVDMQPYLMKADEATGIYRYMAVVRWNVTGAGVTAGQNTMATYWVDKAGNVSNVTFDLISGTGIM